MRIATCHPDRKYHSKGMCKQCYMSAWRAANPDRGYEHSRKHAESNPDRKREATRKWRAAAKA